MDLHQESELENKEHNEIQSTEEAELPSSCPDERSERSHVCCLLSISDSALEEDQRATEFIIGTGWEEAVRGWGKISPTACIWPRKKLRKAKAGESPSSSCLLCFTLAQGSPEARPLVEAGKLEAGAAAEGALEKNEKNRSGAPQTQGPPAAPSAAASREISKLCAPSYMHGEKKSLQIKEFIWCMDDWAIPETISARAPRSPTANRRPHISDSLASKALLILPPLKSSPPSGSDVLGKKSKSAFWQSEEKLLSTEGECVACECSPKPADGKGERRALEPAKALQAKEPAPFLGPAARAAPLAEAEPRCLPWSLLPEKHRACSSTHNTVRYFATLQLLQKQGIQSYKTKLKSKEGRAHQSAQKHILLEAKQENRPRTVEAKLFSQPLLPSLTVSRVVIPISTHRVL